VPYRARLFRGQLRHDPDEAAFHVGLKPPLVRSLLLTNRLPFGVAIWNVSLLLKFSEDVDDGETSLFAIKKIV
jgi:hypothetical protein